MFRTLFTIAFLFSSISMANVFEGKVKLFEGMMVEVPQPYKYYALETHDGMRLLVPGYLNEEYLHQTQAQVKIDGDMEYMMCTDMSRACPTGHFSRVDRIEIHTGVVSIVPFDRFEGFIEHLSGRFVETPHKTYDYYALVTHEGRRVSVPPHINAENLEYQKMRPGVTVYGDALRVMCTDMSPACGPEPLVVISRIEMDFSWNVLD